MPSVTDQRTVLLSGAVANVSSPAFDCPRGVPDRVYQATIAGSGAVSATVTFEGSCDGGQSWSTIGSALSLTGTASDVKAQAVAGAPWPLVRATVASITGTNAAVSAFMAI